MSSVWWSHNGKLQFQEKQWKRELEMTLNQLFQSKLSCAFQMTEIANGSQPHIQQSSWAGRLVITCVYVSEVKTYKICILSKKKGGFTSSGFVMLVDFWFSTTRFDVALGKEKLRVMDFVAEAGGIVPGELTSYYQGPSASLLHLLWQKLNNYPILKLY